MPKTKAKTKATGYALYRAEEGWGYAVEVYRADGTMVKRYTAGDCPHESQTYNWNGRGALDTSTLSRYARQTAKEMLGDAGLKGLVTEDDGVETGGDS